MVLGMLSSAYIVGKTSLASVGERSRNGPYIDLRVSVRRVSAHARFRCIHAHVLD